MESRELLSLQLSIPRRLFLVRNTVVCFFALVRSVRSSNFIFWLCACQCTKKNIRYAGIAWRHYCIAKRMEKRWRRRWRRCRNVLSFSLFLSIYVLHSARSTCLRCFRIYALHLTFGLAAARRSLISEHLCVHEKSFTCPSSFASHTSLVVRRRA